MKKKWIPILLKLGMIILGNLLYALAVTVFIVPNQLLTGGTTGLALFFYHTLHIPVSAFVSVFNLSMFLLGAWILGKQFAATTVLSTILYPLLLRLTELSGIPGLIMEERIVAVLYAGLLIGAGIGIVMRAGASTGGMDIPALILNKKKHLNVSAVIYLCDCLILVLQATETGLSNILYGILLIAVYTLTLDKVLLLGGAKVQLKIISRRHEEINRLLADKIDCGTSLLHMETGYLHKEENMVLAVLSNRDLAKANQLILDIDPEAFLIISRINEVRGRGFTLNKLYRTDDGAAFR